MAKAPLRVLLDEAEIAKRVDALADKLTQVDDDWTVVALLQGAIPFTADLMRAFERRGRHPCGGARTMSAGPLLAAVGLVAVNAFFVAAEFALVGARRIRIEDKQITLL